MKTLLIACCTLVFGLNLAFGQSDEIIENTTPLVEEFENGKIDWTSQYIEATGFTVINTEKYKNKKQAVALAKIGAKRVAQANILEIIEGVKVTRETTVEDFMTASDVIKGRIEGTIKGSRLVGTIIEEDYVEVTVRMPLYSADGLAGLIMSEVQKNPEKFEDLNKAKTEASTPKTAEETDAAPTNDSTPTTDAPETIPTTESPTTNKSGVEEVKEKIEQLIINIKNGEISPSMFPVIIDEDGNVIIDLKEYYDPVKGEFIKYVNLTEEMLEELKVKKGVKIIDAVQEFDGSIRLKTANKPKLQKFLKGLGKVGKVALPILLGFL